MESMESPEPLSVRLVAELVLEARDDLAELGIALLGSEEHRSRVVFHFASDQGEHSISIDREDWMELPGEYLAHEAARRVAAERRRREIAGREPVRSESGLEVRRSDAG
jgi:hypothetical protein